MRMIAVGSFRKGVLTIWAKRHQVLGTAMVPDALNCFPGVTDAACIHAPIPTGGGAPDLGNLIFWRGDAVVGNVKTAPHGTYHALHPGYLQGKLSEFSYRFDRA